MARTQTISPPPPRLPTPSILQGGKRRALAGVLFAVLAFAALAEGGVLLPHITAGSGGAGDLGGGETYQSMDNASWQTWTVTDLRLLDGRSSGPSPSGGTLRVALYPTPYAKAVGTLTVPAGGAFFVGYDLPSPTCGDSVGHETKVGVLLDVATPLGTRTVEEPLTIDWMTCTSRNAP